MYGVSQGLMTEGGLSHICLTGLNSEWFECLPKAWETWVQSQVIIPKTQKMVLDASLLNTQHYKVRMKDKVEQSRERSIALPTCWCSSNRKGSLRVILDYDCQLFSKELHTFPKGINQKVNVIAQLEFELANNDVTIQPLCIGDSPDFGQDATKTKWCESEAVDTNAAKQINQPSLVWPSWLGAAEYTNCIYALE